MTDLWIHSPLLEWLSLHLTSTTRWRIWGAYHFTLSTWSIETSQKRPAHSSNISGYISWTGYAFGEFLFGMEKIPSDFEISEIFWTTWFVHRPSSVSFTFPWICSTPPSSLQFWYCIKTQRKEKQTWFYLEIEFWQLRYFPLENHKARNILWCFWEIQTMRAD